MSNNGGNQWQFLMLEQNSDYWWEYYDGKKFLPQHNLPLEIVVECNFHCSSKLFGQ